VQPVVLLPQTFDLAAAFLQFEFELLPIYLPTVLRANQSVYLAH